MIEKFIEDICEILNINKPAISFDTSNFPTKTMLAQCSPSGDTIYLKKYDIPNFDQLFSIAHELRHIWQMQNDEQLYFSDYRPIDLCKNAELYNLQLAELDANAFGGLIMISLFKLEPLFNGLPASVKSKIYERMEHLMATEFSQ